MAGIGLQYSVYAPLTENASTGECTYTGGKRGRKMIQANIKLNYDKSSLYADDAAGENAREFIDGEISITQDQFTGTMRKDLLGNTTASETVGEDTVEVVTSKDTDTPPYVGFGFIQSEIVDNVRPYTAKWYKKVQFSEPDESAETKGQSIKWQTPVIVGTIMKPVDGEWREQATATSLATAIAWLKSKANITT